ncbi:MAG TPA: hypothetical protein PKY81_11675 [bacterium]|nr:hypothetical protein [bacterium]HPN31607.1 hypothetical protein [bacterium]
MKPVNKFIFIIIIIICSIFFILYLILGDINFNELFLTTSENLQNFKSKNADNNTSKENEIETIENQSLKFRDPFYKKIAAANRNSNENPKTIIELKGILFDNKNTPTAVILYGGKNLDYKKEGEILENILIEKIFSDKIIVIENKFRRTIYLK